jgi:hypothetical protein
MNYTNPKYKKRIIETCRRYYNTMKTYGEPPQNFTSKDYDIVDNICDLIRQKYKKRLIDNLDDKEKEYLEIFTPELLPFAKY